MKRYKLLRHSGVMEQSLDGEWCRFDEAVSIIANSDLTPSPNEGVVKLSGRTIMDVVHKIKSATDDVPTFCIDSVTITQVGNGADIDIAICYKHDPST